MAFAGLALGLLGSAIGGSAFGPTGAKVGFLLGSTLGSTFDKTKIPGVEGPRLRDLQLQTSTYGVGMTRLFGSHILKGNVIWATNIKEVEHRATVGSKGARQEQVSYTYELPGIAISLGEGEISEILRVWVNDFLVYEATTDTDTVSGDGEALAYLDQQLAFYAKNVTYRIYKGTATQDPDPLIQSYEGVDNTPAYRHQAYIVIEDLPLELFGNTVPNFTFEVVAKAKTFQTVNTSIEYLQPTYKHLGFWTEGPVPGSTTRAQTAYVQTNLSLNSGAVIETYHDDYTLLKSVRRIAAASLSSRSYFTRNQSESIPFYSVFHASGLDWELRRVFDDKNETYFRYGDYRSSYVYTGEETGSGQVGSGDPSDITKVSTFIYNPSNLYINNQVIFKRTVSLTSQRVKGPIKLGDKFFIADDSGSSIYRFYYKTGVIWNAATGSSVEHTLLTGSIIGTSTTNDTHITSDGTFLYALYFDSGLPGWVVKKWNQALTLLAQFNLSTLVPLATNEAENRITAFNDGTLVISNPYTLKAHVIEAMSTHADTFDLQPVFIGGTTVAGDYPHWVVLGHRDAIYVRRTFINVGGSVAQWDIYGRVLETRTTTGTTLVPIHSLETTVADILKYAGYEETDFDVSALSAITGFKGYAISKPCNTKSALEQLTLAYSFAIVEVDGKLVASLQGQEPKVTTPQGDLAAGDGGGSFDATLFDYSRNPDIEMPSKVRIQYQSDRPVLTISEQYAERLITNHDDTIHLELSVRLSDDAAARIAEVTLHSAWAARQKVSFQTSRKYLRVVPNSNCFIETPDGTFNVRVTSREYGSPGILIFSGYIESGNLTKSTAKGAKTPKIIFRPDPVLPTDITMLDIPIISDADNNFGAYFALASSQVGWGGSTVWVNKGAGFTQLNSSGDLTPTFSVISLPGNHGPFGSDETNTVVLAPEAGDTSLQSITELAQLYNYNLLLIIDLDALISGQHNAYEIISFRNASLGLDGYYTLSGLIRGLFGTQRASSEGLRTISTSAYATSVLSDLPSGYWRLGESSGLTSFNEVSGSNNITWSGTPTFGAPGLIQGDTNKAVSITNTTSIGTCSNTGPLAANSNFSIEAWFSTTSSADSQLFGTWSSTTNLGMGIGKTPTQKVFMLFDNSSLLFTTTNAADGQRHYLVATYSGASPNIVGKLYYDGVLVATSTATKTVTLNPTMAIGGYVGAGGGFVGVADECAIYPSVLTDAQILSRYNVGTTNPAISSSASSVKAYLLVDHEGAATHSGRVVGNSVLDLDGTYKAVTFGLSFNDVSPVYVLANKGWAKRPYPVNNPTVSGPASGSGTYTVTWSEVSRLSQGWEDTAETPVDFEIDEYIIQVVNMENTDTPVRTVSTLTNSLSTFTYTPANYSTDFGVTVVIVGFKIFSSIGGRRGNGVLCSTSLPRFQYISYI